MASADREAYDRRTAMIEDYIAKLTARIEERNAKRLAVSPYRRRLFPWRIKFERF